VSAKHTHDSEKQRTLAILRASLLGDSFDLSANEGPRQNFSGGTSSPSTLEMRAFLASSFFAALLDSDEDDAD
jgi:hypothetical protein